MSTRSRTASAGRSELDARREAGADDRVQRLAQTLCLMAFSAVATVTLLLCVMTGPDRDDLDEFYTGYSSLSPMRNGLAIAGDYISAATVLGTGRRHRAVRLRRHRAGAEHALSLMLLMFLLAEPLRNAGRFTMGDALARRMPGRGVRIAACLVDPRRAAAADAGTARGHGATAGVHPRISPATR